MSEGGEAPKLSLGELLKTKSQQVGQEREEARVAEEQRVKDDLSDKLEAEMDKVDETQEKIGGLSGKQEKWQEAEDRLAEDLTVIRENVVAYKQSRENLKNLFETSQNDENLRIYFQENGINSWRDFVKNQDFAESEEVVALKQSKEAVRKSAQQRKSDEDNIRNNFGVEEKGKSLEGRIKKEKTVLGGEMDSLKMETPDGRAEVREKTRQKADKKMDEWFDKTSNSTWSDFFILSDIKSTFINKFNLIDERIDLSNEAKILKMSETDLWKAYYEKKITQSVEIKVKEIRDLTDELGPILDYHKFTLNHFDDNSQENYYRRDTYLGDNLKSFTHMTWQEALDSSIKRSQSSINYDQEIGLTVVGSGLKFSLDKAIKNEDGTYTIIAPNKEKIDKYIGEVKTLVNSMSGLGRMMGGNEKMDIITLLRALNNKSEMDQLLSGKQLSDYDLKRVNEIVDVANQALVAIKNTKKSDLNQMTISEQLMNLLKQNSTPENAKKSLDTRYRRLMDRDDIFKRAMTQKLNLELAETELKQVESSQEMKEVGIKKENESGLEKRLNDIESALNQIQANEVKLVVVDGVVKVGVEYRDAEWLGRVESSLTNLESQIIEAQKVKGDRGLFDVKGKKEDDEKISRLQRLKQEAEAQRDNARSKIRVLEDKNKNLIPRAQTLIDGLKLTSEEITIIENRGKSGLDEIIRERKKEWALSDEESKMEEKKRNLTSRVGQEKTSWEYIKRSLNY